MSGLSLALALTLSSAPATAPAAAPLPDRVLQVGTIVSPPFVTHQGGRWSGTSIELWREIAGELGLRFEALGELRELVQEEGAGVLVDVLEGHRHRGRARPPQRREAAAQLAELLFEQIGLNKRESKDMIDAFFDLIATSLVDGQDVSASDLDEALASLPAEDRPAHVRVVDELPMTLWHRPIAGPLWLTCTLLLVAPPLVRRWRGSGRSFRTWWVLSCAMRRRLLRVRRRWRGWMP